MIRINLVKKERRGIALPDLSGLRSVPPQDLLREKALYIASAVGLALLGAEIFYAYRLKEEISSIRVEVNTLTAQMNRLKKKVSEIQSQEKALQDQINTLKQRIEYIEMSKDVIIVLKGYYQPFNRSLGFLYTYTPSTVWFSSLTQNMDFKEVNVELAFGSYDINSIKNFFSIVKREFPLITPGEISKKENRNGIVYYVSSVKARKNILGEEE